MHRPATAIPRRKGRRWRAVPGGLGGNAGAGSTPAGSVLAFRLMPCRLETVAWTGRDGSRGEREVERGNRLIGPDLIECNLIESCDKQTGLGGRAGFVGQRQPPCHTAIHQIRLPGRASDRASQALHFSYHHPAPGTAPSYRARERGKREGRGGEVGRRVGSTKRERAVSHLGDRASPLYPRPPERHPPLRQMCRK